VLLATSFENECDYCMAAHSMVAGMVGVDEATRSAIRQGSKLPDPRLDALWGFSRKVVRDRGRVAAADLSGFLDAGFTRANVLEVVTGVAMKTLSNLTTQRTATPLDEAFEGARWTPPGAAEDAAD
jgi:AhpD family alkylhydroperoxidase